MNKKEKRIAMQNDLISRVYDLILDEKTPNDEKSKLIEFKNSVENGKDFEKEIMHLAENLRKLSLVKFNNKEKLSSELGKLYMDISSTGFIRNALGRGIVNLSFLAGK